MTKRRWLKTAIEESKKLEVTLPWARDAARIDPAVIAALKTGMAKASASA